MRSLLLTLAAVIGLIITSCIKDDFDYSSDCRLTFSADTISFGTVFTDLHTPTARLIAFNPNKKGVVISSISFKNPDTPFSFNVDGVSGKEFRDVEIRGRDSIYIFIECYLPPNNSAKPALVSDQLQFIINGAMQEVEVEAVSQDVVRLKGITLESDFTMTPEYPYIIFDSLIVEKDVTLRIEPGTQLMFHDKGELIVKGCLDARGTPEAMIDFRGDRLDNILPDVSYDIMSGQWKGVRIDAGSYDNRIEFVDMRSTSEGLRIDSCGDLSRLKLTMLNSWLHNSSTTVLDCRYARTEVEGCCFSEAAEAVVRLTGGDHRWVQNTIANNYLFSAIREANLSLYHCLPDEAEENKEPLMRASFDNCIIYGLGTTLNTSDLTGSDVFLRYTLLKPEGEDDANFINCLWDEDPLFLTVREDYYFNYRLQPDSPAASAGNPAYINESCLYDMDGVNRLEYGNPSLGAYAVVPPDESVEKRRSSIRE